MTGMIIRVALLLALASAPGCSVKMRKEQWCVTKAGKDLVCATIYVPYRHCAP